MADDTAEFYSISAEQLFEETAKRDIITCSLATDIALGGGIPLGCTVLIGGKAKLGKTTISLQFGANAQNKYGSKIFYFNIEGRLSKLVLSQIQGIKLDKDHFEVVMPPVITDKKGNVIGYKKVGSNYWWAKIGQVISENPKSVVIVDSIAALSSEKEVSEGMGYQGRGDGQKLEAQFCRKYGDIIVPNRVTVFLLTHIQANTSGYGPPVQIKAGNAVKHTADIILFGKTAEKWKEQDGRILGHDMIYNVECSALGPPHTEMRVPLRYGTGIDVIKDIITQCINWEIIKKAGAWYTIPFTEKDGKIEFIEQSDDKEIKLLKFQGEDNIRNWLLIRPNETKILEDIIRKKIFG